MNNQTLLKEALEIRYEEYGPVLTKYGVSYIDREPWLCVGETVTNCKWSIYISVRTSQMMDLLNSILPILAGKRIPFCVVKSGLESSKVNNGYYGPYLIGKVIQIQPTTTQEIPDLAQQLISATKKLKGTIIPNCIRLGEVVYAAENLIAANSSHIPRKSNNNLKNYKQFPLKVEQKYKRKKDKRIVGSNYILTQVIHWSPKGNVYKAINIKRLAFAWCLVKQGNANSADDYFDRDMKDRLLWQKEVMQELHDVVSIPRYIDFVDYSDFCFLVMEYVEGEILYHKVKNLITQQRWENIEIATKGKILTYYLDILKIIQKVHERGYVHRDITDSNFIVRPDGKLYLIDFELSCSLNKGLPNPPYTLGSFGYMSPEQIENSDPSRKEDIYSLGALLLFMITGISPIEVIKRDMGVTKEKIEKEVGVNELAKLILQCLQPNPVERPELEAIEVTVSNYSSKLEE